MKILPGLLLQLLLLPLLTACARTVPLNSGNSGDPAPEFVPAPSSELDCELILLENESADAATATFRVTNDTPNPVVFHGYSATAPLFQQEVLVDDAWQPRPLGWCGTGVSEHSLAPGASLELRFFVPRDGVPYRFRFGTPEVATPSVSAAPE